MTDRPIRGQVFNSTTWLSEPVDISVEQAIQDIAACLSVPCYNTEDSLTRLQVLYDLCCCALDDPADYPTLRAIADRWQTREHAEETLFAPYMQKLFHPPSAPLRLIQGGAAADTPARDYPHHCQSCGVPTDEDGLCTDCR